jgi:hypothetical protein
LGNFGCHGSGKPSLPISQPCNLPSGLKP